MRGKMTPHRALIERLWAEGKSCKEIGRALGLMHPFMSGPYRAQGYNLPHRYAVKGGKRVSG